MRILLIGGTGFIGPNVAAALLRDGHEVFLFHRGRTHAPRGTREVIGDRRHLAEHAAELRAEGRRVVDVILSSGAQARELMRRHGERALASRW